MDVQQTRIIRAVNELIAPIAEELDLELVEVQFQRESHGQVLRLIIDTPTGVTLDHCSQLSREASHLLDVEDIIPQAYNLEVTSPGLDRPLKTARDFERNIGRRITIQLAENPADKIEATIVSVIEDRLCLDMDGQEQHVKLDDLAKARLVI